MSEKATHGRLIPQFILITFLTGGALCTLLAFFGQFHWMFDLLSHFRAQYLVLFIVLFLIALFLKSKYLAIIAFVFFVINFFPFLPFYTSQKPSTTTDENLLIMMANVQMTNREYTKALQYITKVKPDVIFLLEVDDAWTNELSELKSAYPYQISEPRTDYVGIILLSKRPLQNPRIESVGKKDSPTIVTEIQMNKKTIMLIGTHPVPPFNRKNDALRNDQIEKLGIYINKNRQPTILVGDLNASPFSYPYKKLLEESNLTNCANGFGYQSTWHHNPFMPPLGLSIDHCLHTKEITVLDSYVGEDIGSDHKPIINRIMIQ